MKKKKSLLSLLTLMLLLGSLTAIKGNPQVKPDCDLPPIYINQ